MRIAFISTWKAPCGIATYTMHLAEELAKKHDVMIFAEDRDVSGYDDSQKSLVPFTECWSRHTGFWRLLDEVRRFEPDIVHVQHEFSLFYQNEHISDKFLDVCRKLKAPLVITYHTIPIPIHRYWTPIENPVQRIMLDRSLRGSKQSVFPMRLRREIAALLYEPAVRRFFAESDEIFAGKIVHNQTMHTLAVTRYGLSDVAVINHGVTPCTLLDVRKCRRKLDIPEDSIVITSFGFVSESKGLMELIDVIREFEDSERAHVRFYHVGGVHGTGNGKPYMKQCLSKIANMDSIKITGYVSEEELPVYYSASDIFVLNYAPGTAASASGWAANLMGTMRPLLTTQETNRTDEIIHNHNCVKVPYNDRQAMLNAIRNLISHEALYSRIVERAHQYSQENSWGKIAKKHETLYEEIIGHEMFHPTPPTFNAFTLLKAETQKHQQPLENYFKKAENKPHPNGIRKIDFIYMISLDHKRFDRSTRQLSQYDIHPYRFEAVDDSELPQELINQLGTPTFCEGMGKKQIGIALNHLSVLQDAYESGYETIWVMEDDIQVIQTPRILSDMIDELDRLVGDWDLFYTDIEMKLNGKLVPCLAILPRPNFPRQRLTYYLRRRRLSKNFTEIGMRYGSYSMIIRRSGMNKILEYFKKHRIYLPIDMDLGFIPGLKQITCNHEIVSHMPEPRRKVLTNFVCNNTKFLRKLRFYERCFEFMVLD